MNNLQNNTSEIKLGVVNTNPNKKEKTVSVNRTDAFSNDQQSHGNETKKKISQFFAGLPFNPEP